MNDRKRKRLSFPDETNEYIETYMEENKITYPGDAIARICKEHEEMKGQEWSLKYITSAVTNNLHSVLKQELTKIRLGANSADRNTQILIELFNGLLFHEGVDNIMPTTVEKMEGIKTATQVVDTRISHMRQKKIDHESTKNNVT